MEYRMCDLVRTKVDKQKDKINPETYFIPKGSVGEVCDTLDGTGVCVQFWNFRECPGYYEFYDNEEVELEDASAPRIVSLLIGDNIKTLIDKTHVTNSNESIFIPKGACGTVKKHEDNYLIEFILENKKRCLLPYKMDELSFCGSSILSK